MQISYESHNHGQCRWFCSNLEEESKGREENRERIRVYLNGVYYIINLTCYVEQHRNDYYHPSIPTAITNESETCLRQQTNVLVSCVTQ